MKTIRCISRLSIAAALLVLLASMAHGDILLNYQYSGEIVEVDDPFGVFGQNQIGDAFNGIIKLANGALDSNSGGIAEYSVDVVGQPNRFTAHAAGQSWQPALNYLVQIVGPTSGFAVGNAFQFDLDQSMLDLSGLPSGTMVFDSAVAVSLLSSNFNLPTSYPNLPNSMHPLSEYDIDRFFLIYVNYFNPSNGTSGSASLFGEITSLHSVPEPAMGIYFVGLMIGTISTIRRRAVQTSKRTGTNPI